MKSDALIVFQYIHGVIYYRVLFIMENAYDIHIYVKSKLHVCQISTIHNCGSSIVVESTVRPTTMDDWDGTHATYTCGPGKALLLLLNVFFLIL